MNQVFAETTDEFVTTSSQNPPHALLLSGPVGIGSYSLAETIAKRWGNILDIIKPESQKTGGVASISVETVRTLYEKTRTKMTKPQVVIVDDADAMTTSAQNALLKLLEEPVPNIHFILTSHRPEKLLPTVRSRLQEFVISPISSEQSNELARAYDVNDETKLRQILFVANGLPAEITRLASDEKYFNNLVENMGMARKFIEGDRFDRIVIISSLKDNRAFALQYITTVTKLLQQSVRRNPTVESIRLLDRLLSAYDAIVANGNIRLQLISAVV